MKKVYLKIEGNKGKTHRNFVMSFLFTKGLLKYLATARLHSECKRHLI